MADFLQGVFKLSQSKSKYNVTVNTKFVTYQKHEDEKAPVSKISVDDIIGCDIMKSKNANIPAAHLKIYAYVHKKKFARASSRQRQVLSLEFNNAVSSEENEREASKWCAVIQSIIRGGSMEGKSMEELNMTSVTTRRMLVLVNPFSGPGKAPSIFQDKIAPMFNEAGVAFNLIVTEYAGHAKNLVTTLDLAEFYGIVIVSGDGLLYEVINGLMERSDWSTAIQTPLGILPGGSGNALCCAINSSAGEPYLQNFIVHSTFLLVRHVYPRPMDLVAVDLSNGQRLYSFLAVAWGMISDVDIESERFRKLGSARFTLGALIRIVGLRKYHGTLSFLPVDPYPPPSQRKKGKMVRSKSVIPDSGAGNQSAVLRSVSVKNKENLPTLDEIPPIEIYPDDATALAAVEQERSKRLLAAGEPNAATVDLTQKSAPEVQPSKENIATKKSQQQGKPEQGDGPHKVNCDSAKAFDTIENQPKLNIPPLDKPVPDNWVTIQDRFITVCISYQSHLAPDYIAEPDRGLHTGCMLLSFVRHGATRPQLTRSMLAAADGERLSNENFETVRIKAFRLVPHEEDGILTVDGELVKYGAVQGETLPGWANMMC